MALPLLETDPVASLVHDHANINRLLLELGQEMEAVRNREPVSAELEDALHALRDLMFLHFAQEEEGLFPFVAEVLPQLAEQVQQMGEAHDGICGGLSRMIHMIEAKAEPSTLVGVFDRFEHAYATHARQETQLLEAVDREATPEQRGQLAELVRGL